MSSLGLRDPKHLGSYTVVRPLGAGGMGQVYLGKSTNGQAVAIKIIKAALATEPGVLARFRREIAAISRVNHRFIAQFIEGCPTAQPPFLVTEFVPGLSLEQTIKQFGPLSETEIRLMACQLTEALEVIHNARLIHRDLKPSNIILSPIGPKIIDFGIVRALDESGLTATAHIVATAGFASPEHLNRQPITPASDIFSLGSLLAYATTGRPPFRGKNLIDQAVAVLQGRPDLDGISQNLLPIIESCLSKYPRRRPTLLELRQLLGQLSQAHI